MLLLSKVNIYERLRRRRRGWKEPSGRQGGAAARSHPAAPARRGDGQKRSSTGQGEPKYPRGIPALPPGLGMLSQFSRALPSPARAAKEQWERMRSRQRSTWGCAVGSCAPTGPPRALPAPLVPNFVPLGGFSHSLDGGEVGAAQPSCQTHGITTAGRIPGVPSTRIRGGSTARGRAATPPTGPWPPAPGGSSRGDSAPAAAGSRPRAATLFTFRALYLFQEIIKAAHAGSEFGLK